MKMDSGSRFFPDTKTFGALVGGIACGLIVLILLGLPKKWLVGVFGGFSILLFALFSSKARPALLVFLIISILVNFDFHLTYVPGYIGISDGIAIGNFQVSLMLLVLLALFGPKSERPDRIRFFPQTTIPFLILVIAGIFSFVNSSDRTLSFYGLLNWVGAFVFYFYMANNLKTAKELKLVLLAMQIGILIQGGVCIVQAMLKTNFTLNFQVFGQDPYSTVFRSGGLTGSPNYAGAYIAGIIPITFAQLLIMDNKREKLFAFVALLIGTVGMLLTFSRATWVALFLALLPTSFLLMKQRLLKFRHLAWALLPVFVLILVFQEAILSRVGEGSENLDNRANLFTTAVNMISAHPLLGIGINTYTHQMAAFTVREMYYHWDYMVHNKYLHLWSETGIFGLLSFVTIALVAAVAAFRLTRKHDRIIAAIGTGIFGAILMYAIHMNFETYGTDLNQYWLMVALTVALGVLGYSAPDQKQKRELSHPIANEPKPKRATRIKNVRR